MEPLEAEVELGAVRVRRRLTLERDELVVKDELFGSGEVEVRTSLPLGAQLSPEVTGGLTVSDHAGWLSERMLERTPVTVVCATGVVRLPAQLGWTIPLGRRVVR
jgi:hypothetical protein